MNLRGNTLPKARDEARARTCRARTILEWGLFPSVREVGQKCLVWLQCALMKRTANRTATPETARPARPTAALTAPTKIPRCTKAEKARRVAMVLRWLAQGYGDAEIVRHAAREWRVSQRQSPNYLAAASAMHAHLTCAASNLTPTGAPASKQARHRRPATPKRNPPLLP